MIKGEIIYQNNVLKIIDFSVSHITTPEQEWIYTKCGTPGYCAELLFGYIPFKGDYKNYPTSFNTLTCDGFQPIVKEGCGPWFPKEIQCSENAKKFISQLLQKNQEDRPTCKQSLKSQWLVDSQNDQHVLPELVYDNAIATIDSFKIKLS